MIGFFSRTMALLGLSVRGLVRQSHYPGRLFRTRQSQLHARPVFDLRAVRCALLDRSFLAASPRNTEVPASIDREPCDSHDSGAHVHHLPVFRHRQNARRTWVTGEASWLSFAIFEYQSLDMTWMATHPYAARTS